MCFGITREEFPLCGTDSDNATSIGLKVVAISQVWACLVFLTDMSDISKIFEVDDILTLPEDMTASERRGLAEKNGYSFLGSEFSFLIVVFTFGAG